MESSKVFPGNLGTEGVSRRRSVPITVLVPERQSVEHLQRLAAHADHFVIASDETLASAGLLGLIRVGRAAVTAPDVTSRTPGCECCQLRVDLLDAIRHAVLRRTPPERVIVVVDQPTSTGCGTGSETACDEDPAGDIVTCVHTLEADSEVERLAHLDGLVVEVDACTASTRLASGLRLWSGQAEAALAIADRIVVTGAALLTMSARSALINEARKVNRIGRISLQHRTEDGVVGLVGLDAWGQAPMFTRGVDQAGSTIDTVVLTRPGVLDPDDTDAWLDQVVAEAPSRLLRFQAALRVSTTEPRVCIRGSRSVMRSQPERDPATTLPTDPRGDGDNVVVLIGRELDRCSLSDGFDAIEAGR